MANYKTINLAGAEAEVQISDKHCDIRNDGTDIVYAGCRAGISAGADGVVSIPAGQAVKLLDTCGVVYLLGTGSVQLCGNDYGYPVFKTSATASGEGGGVDEVARNAINTHAGNSEIHLTAEDAIEAVATVISNPNLLRNPDFSINQRGLAEYSGPTYTVDGWYKNVAGIVAVTDNGIALSDEALIRQAIENFSDYYGKTLTVSCEYDGVFKSGTFVMSETGSIAAYWDSDIRITIFQNNGQDWLVFTPQDTANSHTLNWAKLELGSVATLFTPPDPAVELLKCQRYYQIHTTGDIDPIDLRPTMATIKDIKERSDGNYEYIAEL